MLCTEIVFAVITRCPANNAGSSRALCEWSRTPYPISSAGVVDSGFGRRGAARLQPSIAARPTSQEVGLIFSGEAKGLGQAANPKYVYRQLAAVRFCKLAGCLVDHSYNGRIKVGRKK